jgi:putative porin
VIAATKHFHPNHKSEIANHKSWLIAGLLISAAARAQTPTPTPTPEPQYFEQPAEKPHLVFQWDALARYDSIYHLRVRPDIERGRFEVRPELDFVVSDRFKIGARAVGELGTDHNENNGPNFDNYRSRGATLERYFVEGRPGQFVLRAGAFGMPILASEMLWDHDIQTPGAAAAWEIPAGESTVTIAGAGFYGPQREGDQTRIGVGQVIWRWGDPTRFQSEIAGSYWHFEPDDLKNSYFRQNYFTIDGQGQRHYVSQFHVADLLLRLRFPIGRVPMMVSLDTVKNYGTRGIATDDGNAYEASVTAGRVGNPWDWRVFYTYQYVDRDALVGAYNTDDWWFHTWYRGSRIGVALTVFPRLFVQGTVMFQKRLDLSTTLNRVMVELVKMF